jgi:hypothetical protein
MSDLAEMGAACSWKQKGEDKMLRIAIITCVLLASAAAFGADGPITINGCVTSGVEGCLFIKSPQGSYALYVAPPRPDPGRGIGVTGTVSNGPNLCMAGPGIKVDKWSYNLLPCEK